MKKGIIKIIGGIGSYTTPDGNIVKGVDLTDVIAQVRAQGEVDAYTVIVKSVGGVVSVGYDIYNYLRGLKKPITTIVDKQSASIATVVSLAGDKGQRLIVQGSEFFIHNPWITETGTADQLAETSSSIKETEKNLVAFYSENTGITKEGIAPLMRDETGLTPEKAVELGFCDKIITPEEALALGVTADTTSLAKAFALLTNTQNKNQIHMKEVTGIKAALAAIQKKLGIKAEGATVVALDWTTTDTALKVVFESAGDVPVVGDAATIDGKPAADGTYNFDQGYIVILKGGVVESITQPQAGAEETPAALKAKVTALEAEKATLKTEKAALEAKVSKNETDLAELAKTVETIGKHITTDYKVKGAGQQGNGGEGSGKSKSMADNTYFTDRLAKAKAKIQARNEKK